MTTRTVSLTANVVSTVTVAGEFNAVGVFHTGNDTNPVHARLGGTDPVAWADDTYMVPSGARRQLSWSKVTGNTIKLISLGPVRVEVEFA
jgi:hypothetical protein